jgi:hypothetical protein
MLFRLRLNPTGPIVEYISSEFVLYDEPDHVAAPGTWVYLAEDGILLYPCLNGPWFQRGSHSRHPTLFAIVCPD